jgi:hypothetical protein
MCVSICVALWEVQHHNTETGGWQRWNSAEFILAMDTLHMGCIIIFFKKLVDDNTSACSYELKAFNILNCLVGTKNLLLGRLLASETYRHIHPHHD